MERFDGIRAVHYQARDPGLVWTKDPEPCIGPDSPLDSLSILTPNVVRLPAGGYRLYYTGWGPGRAVPDANGYILSAVSGDGAAWRKEPGVRLDVHEPDATLRVLCPDVVPLPDGRWRMYYEAASPERPTVIKSAASPDGLAWEPEPGVRAAAPDASFGSPRCVYVESPSDPSRLWSRLYFHSYAHPRRTGLDAPNHIISAISDDGLSFRIEPGVRIAQEDERRDTLAVYAPEVLRLGDPAEPRYRMYFSAWATDIRGGIFAAASRDGLTWTGEPGPLLDLDRPLDVNMVSEPCVIDLDDGRFRLFYEAEDEQRRRRILSATSG